MFSSAVSESRLSNPIPSPSPSHLRVRVRESESKKNSSPSHESSSPHIQHLFIFQNMKNKQQNVSNVRVNSATRHGRYCLDSGVTRARVTISESESKWKKMDSSPSPSKVDSSHTAPVFSHGMKELQRSYSDQSGETLSISDRRPNSECNSKNITIMLTLFIAKL